jgi:hypothetical protein
MKTVAIFFLFVLSTSSWGYYLGLPVDLEFGSEGGTLDLKKVVQLNDFDTGSNSNYHWREIEITFCPKTEFDITIRQDQNSLLPSSLLVSEYHDGCHEYQFKAEELDNANDSWILVLKGSMQIIRLSFELEMSDDWQHSSSGIMPTHSTNSGSDITPTPGDGDLPPVFMEPGREDNDCNPDEVCDDWGRDDDSYGGSDDYIGALPIF